jgi:deoxyribodipyrimidine photo-lyase
MNDMKGTVPPIRVQAVTERPVNAKGDFVLYWMIACRRTAWNFALQRAVDWAMHLGKPLVILEALRVAYPWASDRFHRFILDGMADNEERIGRKTALYYPYLEPRAGAGKGLLAALADRACVLVSDDFPAFFLPRMVLAAAQAMPVHMEKVDSNGILPMRAATRVFPTAFAFRRFLQKHLPDHLLDPPRADPLKGVRLPRLHELPAEIRRRWPSVSPEGLKKRSDGFSCFPIDHRVGVAKSQGGAGKARQTLRIFLDTRLSDYADKRNQPEVEVTSGLSPYLHFGHLSVHEVFHEILEKEGWSPDRLSDKATGSRSGWWGMSACAEAFLDQLITWRELGFNLCWQREDYDRFGTLPAWALATLKAHERDERPYTYTLEEFERAETHDPLWNAAQRQLVREGRIHNYLRMLWGKKILEWSPTPRNALDVMIELNNKYALDGRDPNSYSGIFWVLGRYDRPWAPERAVFGTVRYMSSQNTARKVSVKGYIGKYLT